MDEQKERKKRIDIIDAARGFAVTLMVIHHALYNCAVFLGAPWWLYSNPVFNVLQAIFIGLFIFISGISSRFSRGNTERGAKVMVIAVIISYVTNRMGMPINFGILHLLGAFMMFYGLTRKLWDKIPRRIAPYIYVALTIIAALARMYLSPSSENLIIRDILSVLGWWQPGFVSYDYQVVLPWIFVFLMGTWTGAYIHEGRFPSRFYEMSVAVFPFIGRYALLIYVLHQPVLYSIAMLAAYLMA